MTAQVSTEKKIKGEKFCPPLHNWKQGIKNGKKLAIILTVLHMVSMPAALLSVIISVYSGGGFNDSAGISVIAVLTTALAGFMGIFPAVSSFACLNDKTVVDMRLSLPMTATQRFISNFLSGLFTYIAPFLTSQVFSVLLALYGRLFMEGRTFYLISYDGPNMRRTPYVCEGFADMLPIVFKLIAGGVLAMLMLYTITVLITVCCGSKFESIAYTILINGLIPLTIFAVTYSMFEDLYGIDSEVIAYKLILFTSTAGGVLATVDWATNGDLTGLMDSGGFNYGVWALVYLLIIAALFALAFFLYRKRRAEQVSKPFVFKLAYYITVTCGTFSLIALIGDFIPAIIVTAVVYMIFEVVTNRGFKRFWLSIIKYVGTFIAAVLLIFVGQKTDGFWSVYRVPAAATVTSAEIYYAGYYHDFPGNVNYYNGTVPIVIKDKENIKTLISAHEAAVRHYKENRDRYELGNYIRMTSNTSLRIKYNLIGGGSFTRSYNGGISFEAAEILTAIDLSEEYRTQVAEAYKENILKVPELYKQRIDELAQAYVHPLDTDFVAYGNNKMLHHIEGTKVTVASLCARGFYEQLADAYYKDIMAINEENYFRSELKNVWYFSIYAGNHYSYEGSISILNVPESFENTVALLDAYDFNLPRVEKLDDRQILRELVNAGAYSDVLLYTEAEARLANNRKEGVLHASAINSNIEIENYVYDFDENVIELVRSIMPRNIVSENGYIISVYGFSGAVPEELNETAAAVPRRGYDEKAEERYRKTVNGVSTKQYYD